MRRSSVQGSLGSYVFYEHGRSADPKLARLQDWFNPLWRLSGLGCGRTINRPIDSLIEKAGFRIDSLERYTLGRPRIMLEIYRGVAAHNETQGNGIGLAPNVPPAS
jgi:hypothetical protein